MNLQNKVILITGAAGALGQATAAAFAEAGARMVLADLSDNALQAAYPGNDSQRLLCSVDLLDATAAVQCVDAALQAFGRLDALCNIAGGFSMGTPVHATPMTEWKKMWDINAQTMLNAVQAAVPKLLTGGGGFIVNVGAGAGQKAMGQMGAYSVAKSAVIRMTEAMSAELRDQNINVNCVLPSIIDTPANRAAMPEADPSKWVAPGDLARVIRFLCSDEAHAIHGAAIPVTGLS
jgi:NAD(P)-dependent dehydrogenase (short-subunit alcohol dehydrogenase family)